MRGSVVRGVRLAILVGMIGLGLGEYGAGRALGASRSSASQPAAELLYQGKILPVVTDVYNSINDLGSALNARNVQQISVVATQFTGEQLRLEQVHPIPQSLKAAESAMDRGIAAMSSGSQQLVVGLTRSDNATVQRAATQLTNGLKQFEAGVSLVRSKAGPLAEPTPAKTGATGTPQPTPIIRGLP